MTTYAIILTVMITWHVIGTIATSISWDGSSFGAVIAFSFNLVFLAGLLYIGGVL